MIPETQIAIQLVGPDRLELNPAKAVIQPGEHQILGKVACVGLCFSDMKLLAQFDQHVRKAPVQAHLAPEVLAEIPSYVPEGAPTVPGHEVVIEVVAVGGGVDSVVIGKRYLVQADWRDLKTASSNGAFGYNFEGGLQQYVLLDERTTVAADGTSYLLAVDEERGISANALVEPWACVEDAFIHAERTRIAEGGTVLLVDDGSVEYELDDLTLHRADEMLYLALAEDVSPPAGFKVVSPGELEPETIDDLLFAGYDPDLIEGLWPLLRTGGLCLIVTGGGQFDRAVTLPIGRIHYGGLRIAGYPGTAFAKALARVPESGEVRPGDHCYVLGAGGPMGVMGVIRLLSVDVPDLYVEGSNRNPERLEALRQRAEPVAAARGVRLRLFRVGDEEPDGPVDYWMINAPVPELVAEAIAGSNPGAVVNVFAGIPATVSHPYDLDTYIARGLYFIGTSGSTMDDIHAVLAKVTAGQLDTNLSVGAVSGMGGAIEGLRAVKAGSIPGKIVVYPELGDFPLTPLEALVERFPSIGPLLSGGCWTAAAETELLRLAVPA